MRQANGFGLIELLIVLVIVAILATVVTPSFVGFVNRIRVTTTVNDYVAALHGARSYAVREGEQALLCPTGDGEKCDSSKSYEDGWLITTAPDDSQATQRAWQPSEAVSITNNYPGGDDFIRFGADGLPRQASGAFLAGSAQFSGGDYERCVVLSRTGRLRTESSGC